MHESRRRGGGGLAPFVVVGALVAVVFGGWCGSAVTFDSSPVRVTARVWVEPELGWVRMERDTPAGWLDAARLTDGSAKADVVVGENADARDALDHYLDGALDTRVLQPVIAEDVRRVRIGGHRGVRVLYTGLDRESGLAIEGEVTALVGPAATAVVFDGWADEGQFAFVRDDVVEMTASTTISL